MSALRKMEITQHEVTPPRYSEAAPIRLSERDSHMVMNLIRIPPKATDRLRNAMRKHRNDL